MIPIILNGENLEYMRRAVQSAAIPHALIIEGAEGSGKFTLARHFSAMINCTSDGEKPCGGCGSCKKIFGDCHTDVSLVDLEQDKKSISVSQVRQVISQAALVPSEAKKRIFIIRNGQTLTLQAQNALLKLFEEPPKDVIIMILVTDRRLLLPTVVSRAVVIRTQLLPYDVMLEQLSKRSRKSSAELEAAAASAGGALGKAIELLSGSRIMKLHETVQNYFSLLCRPVPVYSLCEALPPHQYKKDDLAVLFPFFRLAFRDIALCKAGGEFKTLFFTDREIMNRAADNISMSNLAVLYERTERMCRALISNVNPYTAIACFNAGVAEYARLG